MSKTSSMCKTGAVKGVDTQFLLHPLADNQMRLIGISSAQLIGFSSDLIDYGPLDRRIAGKIPGSMSYDDVQITLFLRPASNDQEDLRTMSTDQIEFNDLWLYYAREGTEFTHFQALELSEEPCGTMSISGWSHQSFSRSDLKQVQFTLSVNGQVAEYDRHTETVDWTMTDGVLTAVDADFTDADFRVGMSVIYETGNQTTPYGYGKVTAVTATTLTLSSITLDAASGTGKIHAARIHYEESV